MRKILLSLSVCVLFACIIINNQVRAATIPQTQIGQFLTWGFIWDDSWELVAWTGPIDEALKGYEVEFAVNYGGTIRGYPLGGWDITTTLLPDQKTNYNFISQTYKVGDFITAINYDGNQPTGLSSAPLDDWLTVTWTYGAGQTISGQIPFPSVLVQDMTSVPIPGAFCLFGSGLLGIVSLRKKFRK